MRAGEGEAWAERLWPDEAREAALSNLDGGFDCGIRTAIPCDVNTIEIDVSQK